MFYGTFPWLSVVWDLFFIFLTCRSICYSWSPSFWKLKTPTSLLLHWGPTVSIAIKLSSVSTSPNISPGPQKKATTEQNGASVPFISVFLMALVKWMYPVGILVSYWVVWSHIIQVYSFLQGHFSELFWPLLLLCATVTQACSVCLVWTIVISRLLRATLAMNLTHSLGLCWGVIPHVWEHAHKSMNSCFTSLKFCTLTPPPIGKLHQNPFTGMILMFSLAHTS